MNAPRHVTNNSLSEREAKFLSLLTNGVDIQEATLSAGWAHRLYGYEVMRRPRMQAALHDFRVRLIHSEAATLAIRTMIELMGPTIAAGTRFKAADRILQLAGHVVERNPQHGEKALSEMDTGDLQRMVDRLEAALAERAEPADVHLLEPPDSADVDEDGAAPESMFE